LLARIDVEGNVDDADEKILKSKGNNKFKSGDYSIAVEDVLRSTGFNRQNLMIPTKQLVAILFEY